MINKPIGFDMETVEKRGGGHPYTFQIVKGPIRIYQVFPSQNASLVRNSLLKILNKVSEEGDFVVSYNLAFDVGTGLFRDSLGLFKKSSFRVKAGIKNWRIEGVLSGHTPFIHLYFGYKKLTMIDGAKYFGGEGIRLDDVSKMFKGFRKLEPPKYLGQRFPKPREEKHFKAYAMRDAEVCEEIGKVVAQWHQTAGQEKICYSLAHLMGNYFNDSFCEGRKLDYPGGHIEACAGWAKFGGFLDFHGDSGIYKKMAHVDINSAYPWAMTRMKAYFNGKYRQSLKLEREGIYKISTVLPKNEKRPLFLKRIPNKSLEWQPLNQKISFWVTEPEISIYKKLRRGWKFKILDGYVWVGQNKYRPLKLWSEKFFKLKNEVKHNKRLKFLYEFYKGALNHLTGKFDASIHLNPEEWITENGDEIRDRTRPGLLRNYFVASIIRGMVRAYLWKWANRANSFQEITDSLDIQQKNIKKIPLSKEMGGFSLETKGDLLFIRRKAYLYFDSVRRNTAKPLRVALHGIQLKDWRVLLRLIKKGGGTYTRHKMRRVKGSLAKDGGVSAFSFFDQTFELSFTEKLKREYLKWRRTK